MSLLTVCLLVQSAMCFKLATTSTSCPSADQYWNGTSCTSCTKCGPGYGLKTKCSEKQDTECQECWPGYDWSNNTSMEPCIYCINEVSECLEGNFKIIRNCTTTSPTKCKGCAEGHYFDPGYGEHGGCVPCSQPCDGIFQKETRKCETAHDRLCTARDPTELLVKTTTPVPEQTENIPTSTPVPEKTTNSPSSRRSPNAGTKLPAQLNVIKTDDVPEESTGENKLLFLLFLLALIPAVIGVVVVLRCRQRRRSRKPERKNSRSVEQKRPLMSRTPRGLDTLVRDLPVEDRRFISGWLNGQTTDARLKVRTTMLVFGKRGKPEHPEKTLERGIELTTTHSTHIWRHGSRRQDSNLGHISGRRVLSSLRHPCFITFWVVQQ